MNREDSNGTSFDERTAEYLVHWGQGLSRRGWLAKLGNIAMKIAGVSLVPLLPVDRAQAQTPTCGDWRLCGIFGNVCQTCCASGGSATVCPICTTKGANWWYKCCTDNSTCPPVSRYINYYDCCSNDPNSTSCAGSRCENNSHQDAWCTSGLAYRCTVIEITTPCSP